MFGREIGWVLTCTLRGRNVKIWKPVEMILTVFRDFLVVNLIREASREWEPPLKESGGFWKSQPGQCPLKIWCWSRAQIGAKGTGHVKDFTEAIDEAGIRKVACECGIRGDDGTFRRCWWVYPNARYWRDARQPSNQRALHIRFIEDQSVHATSKMLGSNLMSVSL